jgi:hypothetical protein
MTLKNATEDIQLNRKIGTYLMDNKEVYSFSESDSKFSVFTQLKLSNS